MSAQRGRETEGREKYHNTPQATRGEKETTKRQARAHNNHGGQTKGRTHTGQPRTQRGRDREGEDGAQDNPRQHQKYIPNLLRPMNATATRQQQPTTQRHDRTKDYHTGNRGSRLRRLRPDKDTDDDNSQQQVTQTQTKQKQTRTLCTDKPNSAQHTNKVPTSLKWEYHPTTHHVVDVGKLNN